MNRTELKTETIRNLEAYAATGIQGLYSKAWDRARELGIPLPKSLPQDKALEVAERIALYCEE